METEESQEFQPQQPTYQPIKAKRIALLFINILFLIIGGSGSPLLLRIYFVHGGARKWISAFLQTAGFPLILVPLLLSFLKRRCLSSTHPRLVFLTPPLVLYSSILGLITGIVDLLYAYGASYLPVSTSMLLSAALLGLTALFSFIIVRQKFTAFSINAVVLLTIGAVVLGVDAGGDRPSGVSMGKYYLGFFMTLLAATLLALVMPLIELMYAKAGQVVTYTLVMELQFVMTFVATIFSVVGMAVNKDFQSISREAEQYGLGEIKYYLVLFFAAFLSQLFFIGLAGTINYSSALLGGVIISLCIPLTEVIAVIFLHERFHTQKGIALALSLWGSASYFYGEYKESLRKRAVTTKDVPSSSNVELLEIK